MCRWSSLWLCMHNLRYRPLPHVAQLEIQPPHILTCIDIQSSLVERSMLFLQLPTCSVANLQCCQLAAANLQCCHADDCGNGQACNYANTCQTPVIFNMACNASGMRISRKMKYTALTDHDAQAAHKLMLCFKF